jgi:hypothetical protein
MARKKTIVTTEEVDETPKDQEIDYQKDLQDKSILQVALDTPKDEPKEEVKAEKPEEETETVEFDPEQLKREAVEEAKASIQEALKGTTKEETKENVDEYQEYQKDFFEKNNRQPTWFEVAKFTEDRNFAKLEAKQAEQQKAREDEQKQQQETINKNNEATNKYVEDTLNELYEGDKLPKVQDPKNEDDYGLRVKNALFKTVVDVNQKRIAEGKPAKTIKEIFYEDFQPPRQQVPGADAPVNMGRGGFNPDENNEEINYLKDIAGPRNSFKKILTNAVKRV